MNRSNPGLYRSNGGAVAPTVALSLFALIAAGGLAFDYARLASMDTELQNAADQAALAAASQLDGQDGACARAAAAASALLTNLTFFANDSLGTAVTVTNESACDDIGTIRFYQSWDQSTDTPGPAATTDDVAKVVVVSVTPRQAFYALTPVVAALSSDPVGAQAVASLGSAVCKMPPVMICNPSETGGNTSFDPSAYVGNGLRLTSVGGGSGTWAPGNFGYLDTNGGSNGAPGLREALGWNTPPGECMATNGLDTKPGATVTVTDAMNTRFDIYATNVACPTGGACSASINSVKDVRRPANANNAGQGCRLHSQGWQLDSAGVGYYGESVPTSAAPLPAGTTPSAMGHPRDMCHAVSQTGVCTGGAEGRIGDGDWDADAYFRTNYVRTTAGSGGAAGTSWNSTDWQTNTGLSPAVSRTTAAGLPNPAYASRYNVYVWEMDHRDQVIDGVTVLGPRDVSATGNTLVSYGKPQCSASKGYGSGQIPDATTPDRRRISVAVVNCTANNVQGNSVGVPVEKWIDVFLVEPSLNRARTHDGDMYVEVIGESVAGGAGSTAGQVIRRDVPYLIK